MLVNALSVMDTLLIVKQLADGKIENKSAACTVKPEKNKKGLGRTREWKHRCTYVVGQVEGSRCQGESDDRPDPSLTSLRYPLLPHINLPHPALHHLLTDNEHHETFLHSPPAQSHQHHPDTQQVMQDDAPSASLHQPT